MSGFYRRRNEGWINKVDISVLFVMREATARIRKEAERTENKRILEEVGQLERAIATAYGEVENHDLKIHQMPEGKTLPDPRPSLQGILDRMKERKKLSQKLKF